MFIQISDKLQEKLRMFIADSATILLDLDDGVGKYSKLGVCSLDTSFRLLIVNKTQDQSDYDLTVESDVGPIKIKGYSDVYLDQEMKLEYDDRLALIKLKGSSGVIDGNVPIIDLRKKA